MLRFDSSACRTFRTDSGIYRKPSHSVACKADFPETQYVGSTHLPT
jgi:hypothetical protein